MSNRPPKPPFWRRKVPPAKYDIALLRPETLPKGKRFETVRDAHEESIRSEALLRSTADGNLDLAETLSNCRNGLYQCDRPFCPICARVFRRWLTGRLLRSVGSLAGVRIYTVLLQEARSENIAKLDPAPYRHLLRKRLERAGLDVPVIGGFEMVYKARRKVWVLHINLVIVGGNKEAHEAFERTFDDSDLDRAVDPADLKDPIEQLSYVSKFTTYHRPYERRGSDKSPAKPLNGKQHAALVTWMAQFEFKDFLLLINARRKGHIISIKRGTD
jgi:hypothetical protein